MSKQKIKKQRTSKSWMVTIEGEAEEYKIVGVSSAEEAMAAVRLMEKVPLSARPMRKFKNVDAPVDNVMEVVIHATHDVVVIETDTLPDVVNDPACAPLVEMEEHDPSTLES